MLPLSAPSLSTLGKTPFSTALVVACLWFEVVFYRDYHGEIAQASRVLQSLGVAGSIFDRATDSLSPVLPFLLIVVGAALIYKELALQNRQTVLIINIVSCIVLIALPFLLLNVRLNEIQELLQQLGR